MVHKSAISGSMRPSHASRLTDSAFRVNIKVPDTFSVSERSFGPRLYFVDEPANLFSIIRSDRTLPVHVRQVFEAHARADNLA